ncbi:MAG: type IV secretion protein Rhs [Acinetobacter johnsonii]
MSLWSVIVWFQPLLQKIQQKFELKNRPLTEAEIKLASSIFGNSLNMDSVRIIAHRAVLPHYAISPNGHVYFNIKDWCENFADQPIHQQAWLIHELTHVWQIQQGLAVVRKALFNRQYRYALKQGKQFLSYGIEQQAQMVQDYFLKKHYGEECSAYEQCIPFVAHKASF